MVSKGGQNDDHYCSCYVWSNDSCCTRNTNSFEQHNVDIHISLDKNMEVSRHFIGHIVSVSFIDGRNMPAWWKPHKPAECHWQILLHYDVKSSQRKTLCDGPARNNWQTLLHTVLLTMSSLHTIEVYYLGEKVFIIPIVLMTLKWEHGFILLNRNKIQCVLQESYVDDWLHKITIPVIFPW